MLNSRNIDERPTTTRLLESIKSRTDELKALQKKCDDWGVDGVYRFYHTSFKVYNRLQPVVMELVKVFRSLDPKDNQKLDDMFEQIVLDGISGHFELSHNNDWPKYTRPVVEAYFHCRFFLDQLVEASSLEYAPYLLPEGWAAVLTLFNLR